MTTRLQLLQAYIKEDPSDSFLHHALALELIALNRNVEAYRTLEKLLNTDPDYLPSYYIIGKTAEVLEDKTNAIYWYGKGIEVARNQKDMHTLSELNGALNLLED